MYSFSQRERQVRLFKCSELEIALDPSSPIWLPTKQRLVSLGIYSELEIEVAPASSIRFSIRLRLVSLALFSSSKNPRKVRLEGRFFQHLVKSGGYRIGIDSIIDIA